MNQTEKPDGLAILVQDSLDHDPGFADVWAPLAMVGKLIDERRRQGLSQNQLAERMGVPPATVAEIEDDPSDVAFSRILAYAHCLGAEIDVRPRAQESQGKRPGEKLQNYAFPAA